MDYLPETIYRIFKKYVKAKKHFPSMLIKIYAYQMFRGLAYMHNKNICHRDLKPQNILIDPNSNILKICDFGSAKRLMKGN